MIVDDVSGAGFKLSSHSYGMECLKVKAGMEILASRFETRR